MINILENVIELFNEILLKIKHKVNHQKVIILTSDDTAEGSNKLLQHSKLEIENNEEKKLSECSNEAFSSPNRRDEEKFMQSNTNFDDQLKTTSAVDDAHLDVMNAEIEVEQQKQGEILYKQKSTTLASFLPELEKHSIDCDKSEEVKHENIEEQFKSDEVKMDAKDTDSCKGKENDNETSDAHKLSAQQSVKPAENQKQVSSTLEGIKKFES